MKKTALAIISILVILLAGCSMDSAPTKGELLIQIGADSRDLASGELSIDMDTAYYKVTVGQNAPQMLDKGNYYRQQIEPGYYSVTVEAYNKDNILIGYGTSEVNVLPAEVSTCTVEVKELAGNGRLIIYMDRSVDYHNISSYRISAKIYSVGMSGDDVLVDTIDYSDFSELQNKVIRDLPSGFYYLAFYRSYNGDSSGSGYFTGMQAFRVVNDAETVISCWVDGGSVTFRPHVEFKVLTDSPIMNGPFSIRYSSSSDYSIRYANIRSADGNYSYSNSKIRDGIIDVDHLRAQEGNQQILAEVRFDSEVASSYYYYIDNINVQPGEQFYIEPDSDEFITNRNIGFYLKYYPSISWSSSDWFCNGVNIKQLENWNSYLKDYCGFTLDQAGENTVSAEITFDDGTKKTVSYSFEVKDYSDTLTDIWINFRNVLSDGKLEFSVHSDFAGDLVAYASDKYGNRIGDGSKVENDKWNSKTVSLLFPSDYQADDLYILIEGYKDGTLVATKNCYISIHTNIIKMSLSEPEFGVFTSSEKPLLIVEGLEHYNNYDYRIGYRLGAGEMHYVDGYDGPIEVIMPDDAIQSTYDLHWEIQLYRNGWNNGSSSGKISFEYYPEGLPKIPTDKVYQAVSANSDINGNLTFEYRILTLDDENYYFFRAVATDNRNVYIKKYIEYGTGALVLNGSSFTMNVKTSNGSRRAVACDILENGNVRIDGYEYTALNVPDIKNPGMSYEGSWTVPEIKLGVDVVYSILEKYVNSTLVVKKIFPDIDQLLSVGFTDSVSANIGAYIKDGVFRIGIDADVDLSLFDHAISLAEVFNPYAELELNFSVKSNDILTINGEDYPARITVSSDGSVLVIYIFRDGAIIPIAMSRAADEYSNPALRDDNVKAFDSERYITMEQIAELAGKLNAENSDIYLSLVNSASTPMTVGEDSVEFAGCWNVLSDDIASLDGTKIGVAAGNILIRSSDTDVKSGSFDNEMKEVTFDDGTKLTITEKRVSFGTLILTVQYGDESGELWLEKYSGDAFDMLVKYTELTGIKLGKIVFDTTGIINAHIVKDGIDDVMNICMYSLGDDTITIQFSPDLINLPQVLKDCEVRAGVTVAYLDNEIIFLERLKDGDPDVEFGIKLIDSL